MLDFCIHKWGQRWDGILFSTTYSEVEEIRAVLVTTDFFSSGLNTAKDTRADTCCAGRCSRLATSSSTITRVLSECTGSKNDKSEERFGEHCRMEKVV